MDADRWKRLDELVQSALARPAAEREAFVRDACGDNTAFAAEVLSLLGQAESSGSFLEPAALRRSPLASGQQLGPYRIEAFIDAGGMGEVYRAHDPRLGRDVAIKILPADLAADPERLRRFEQEARAAATLNHPNIVTIYSVEQDEDLRFLTMELVEGAPLSESIPRGGLAIERFLDIAIALADAVAAAHARGIVHRDLKPANVMLTRDGRVKVLDFGLAKLKGRAEAFAPTSPPSVHTEEGRLLGTVAYMSPEQAEGREVDHRSDIFSVGIVLYELATGQRPFQGASTVSLLSAIVKDTPAPLTDLRTDAPRELARIVRRCLAKDPERRYQSAQDLRNELEELRQEVASGGLARPDSAGASLGRRWRSLAWIAGGIAALATIAFVYLAWRGAIDVRWQPRSLAVPAPSVATRIEIPVPLPESVKSVHSLSISPDGTKLALASFDGPLLVFAGGGQLWLYDLATWRVSPVAGVAGAPPQYPFWSPDGRSIAYFQADRLMRIPAAGGIPTRICNLANEIQTRGGTWGAEDTIIFGRVKDGLFRVPAAGGVPVPITTLVGGEGGHLWPQFLPDGRHFTYTTYETPSKVYIASLDSREPRVLVAPARGATVGVSSRAFAFSGFLLTAEEGILRARPLSSGGTDTAGEPELLDQGVQGSAVAGDRLFAASPAVLAYGVEKRRRSRFFLVDRRGRELRAVGPPVLQNLNTVTRPTWSLSPNGQTLAFTQIADDRRNHISLLDLTGSAPDRFTSGPHGATMPLWSPLGDQIVFTQGQNLHVRRIGSEGASDLGISSQFFKVAHDSYGNTLLFAMQALTGVYNLWHLAIDGSRKPELWFPSTFDHATAQFSPDGQWVAYSSKETGDYQVYVRRFPDADRKVKISNAGGRAARWQPGGKALVYIQGDTQGDVLMEVDVDIGETVKAGVPRRLFSIGEHCGYANLPPDFVVCRPIDPPSTSILVVANWAAGLKQK